MQNPFSDSFGFKNPILDFLKETHPDWRFLIMELTRPNSGRSICWILGMTVKDRIGQHYILVQSIINFKKSKKRQNFFT